MNRLYMNNQVSKVLLPLLFLSIGILTGCSSDNPDGESIITIDEEEQTPFDLWLQANYVDTYNIRYKYRYEDKEADMNYYTVPAEYQQAVELAHLVKYLCIEAYDEVGGVDFTRRYFPKEIFTIGEFEFLNNGTHILGTAEGGLKIILMGVNYLDDCLDDPETLNEYYFKTIHHEFTHILNQTVDFPVEFKMVTSSLYVSDSWSDEPYESTYLSRGFISDYSQKSDTEDFAEMLSMYVTNSEETWNGWMSRAGSSGSALIDTKLGFVKSYMRDAWNIDLDELRDVVQRRQKDIAEHRIDLTDLTVEH